MENLYEVLGIDRNATQAEIKAAYRSLAANFHPDVNTDEGAEEKFKAINLAYETLSDFYTRLQYEQEYDAFHGIETRFEEETIVEKVAKEVVDQKVKEQQETPFPQQEKNDKKTTNEVKEDNSPLFPLKWKLTLLVTTPIVILLGIAVLKMIYSSPKVVDENSKPNITNEKPVKKPVKQANTPPKPISILELKRLSVAQPDHCIIAIDSIKNAGNYQEEMKAIRAKAVQQLPAKTAYFFETNDCERGQISFELLIENQPEMSAHLRKKLDFYKFRCRIEANDLDRAMATLDEMEEQYIDDYSIIAAKSQVLHHQMKKPRAALKAYQRARELYQYQKRDAKFITHWQPDLQAFTYATLLANEALAWHQLGNGQQAKVIAKQSTSLDADQTLAYEVIAQQFYKETDKFGYCKYWELAAQNGSQSALEALRKYCE